MKLLFCDWDRRPAVLVEPTCREAFAVLDPGEAWSKVDAADVFHTAGVMSEAAWRSRFEPEFGPLDLSTLPQSGPAFASAAE